MKEKLEFEVPDRQKILFATPRVVIRRYPDGSLVTPIPNIALSSAVTLDEGNIFFEYLDRRNAGAKILGGLTHNEKTGIIEFKDSDGGSYYLRPLRPEDGLWMSKMKMPVPLESLMVKIAQKKAKEGMSRNMAEFNLSEDESLVAFSYPGRTIIAGLIYNDSKYDWFRLEGSWAPLRESDKAALLSSSIIAEISPKRAKEFVDLYDEYYLDIDQISEYEKQTSA